MGTMILKGSTGVYKPVNLTPEEFGETKFEVAEDTCMEKDTISIIFNNSNNPTLAYMSRVEFIDRKTEDY